MVSRLLAEGTPLVNVKRELQTALGDTTRSAYDRGCEMAKLLWTRLPG